MPARPPHLITLVAATALTVLTLNMFLPALPQMQAAFDVSEAVMGLSISGYMIGAAVMQLTLGPLSDRVGRRPVLLGLLAVFCAASLICALATSIVPFLIARLVQSVAVGGSVLASAIVRDTSAGEEAAARLGQIAAAMAIAPMLAPMLGGLVQEVMGWRAIFGLYVGLGLIVLALVWRDVGETRTAPPQIGSLRHLLGARLFWAHTLCVGFSVGTFYMFLTGAPFVGQRVFGLGPAAIGIGLGSITAGFMTGAAVSSRLVRRVGSQPLILVGRAIALTGPVLGVIVFALGGGNVWLMFAATICVGLGNGLTIPNTNAAILSIRPDLAGTAAGVSGAVYLVVGAILTALTTAVLTLAATPERLLTMMSVSVAVSLICALIARRP